MGVGEGVRAKDRSEDRTPLSFFCAKSSWAFCSQVRYPKVCCKTSNADSLMLTVSLPLGSFVGFRTGAEDR